MISKDKIKKRMLKVGTGATALMIILGSTALANNKSVVKKMDAHYGSIQIVYNGVNRTGEFAPFIGTTADDKNGTTYVPLRVMSEIFEKNVQWNQATRTATVTDGNSGMEAFWKNQVAAKDIEISRLNEKIKDLEKEESKKDSISDTERSVRNKYDRHEKIDFDIRLKGDSKDIEAQIEFDGRKYRDQWDDLSERDIERYIEDIYSLVKKDFPKAKFTGYVKDTDSKDKVLTFETNSRGDLTFKFDGSSSSSSDTRSLENKIKKNYEKEFDGFRIESVSINKKSNDVTYTIKGRITSKSDWNSMSESQVERQMKYIEEDITDEYRKANVEGTIYDTDSRKTIAEYRRGSLRDKKEL